MVDVLLGLGKGSPSFTQGLNADGRPIRLPTSPVQGTTKGLSAFERLPEVRVEAILLAS